MSPVEPHNSELFALALRILSVAAVAAAVGALARLTMGPPLF